MPWNAAAMHRTTFMVMYVAADARQTTALNTIGGATRKTSLAQTVQQIARRSTIVAGWWNDDDILPLRLGVGELRRWSRNWVVSLGNVVILDVGVLLMLLIVGGVFE